MSTAISTNTQGGQIAHPPAEASFGQLVSMGSSLLKTGFLPAHIKSGEAFAAIVLMGREMGMSTMAACRKLQCIKGTVTERADSQLARFKSDGGRARFEHLDESKAVLWVRHPNGDEHTETFTMEDAQRAGLGSNDNYKRHPKAMLRSRAITAALKSVGWEGAVGLYDPDEIIDVEPARSEPRPPVEVRPKFEADPTPQPVEDSDPLARARLAVSRATTIADCDRIRARAIELAESGEWTAEQAEEIKKLLFHRAEMLIAEEVPA